MIVIIKEQASFVVRMGLSDNLAPCHQASRQLIEERT